MTAAPATTEPVVHEGRRPWIILAIVALVVAGFVADARIEPAPSRESAGAWMGGMPVAPPVTAIASSWYCAGGTAAPDGVADGIAFVVNPTRDDITGRVTVYGVGVEPRRIPITVPAASRVAVRYQDVLQAPFAGAHIELDGGGAVAEHTVAGPHGIASAPCASHASPTWYFAEGSTARDDLMLLALLNPFPDDAIVDLSFATDQGRDQPGDFQGIVVTGRSVVVVNVADHLRRRDNVATTITARRGRIVADRIQARTAARRGLSLALGIPRPRPTWYYPDGIVADGVTERFNFYNPTDEEAVLDLEINLDEGAIEPFEVRVPPNDRVTLDLGAESRIPRGVGYSAIIRSLNGVAVVTERSADAAAPAARAGLADTVGATRAARQWVFAVGSASGALDEWITVLNPGRRDVTVSVTVQANGQRLVPEALDEVEIPAGRRVALRLTDHTEREDLPLVVDASGPVVAQRDLFVVNGAGISRTIGIPGARAGER